MSTLLNPILFILSNEGLRWRSFTVSFMNSNMKIGQISYDKDSKFTTPILRRNRSFFFEPFTLSVCNVNHNETVGEMDFYDESIKKWFVNLPKLSLLMNKIITSDERMLWTTWMTTFVNLNTFTSHPFSSLIFSSNLRRWVFIIDVDVFP